MSDDMIRGGDTPFVPFSEARRAFPEGHKALAMEVDGKDKTRDMHLVICALMWNMAPAEPRASHAEFMREFVAGANLDLRTLGLPMISLTEVERWAAVGAIRDASRNQPPGDTSRE